jgi:hypothetical protein
MPPLVDEQTRGNVIRQWISGFPRDTIAEQNNIGAGTVSSIVANYKIGLDELDFNSVRLLSIEIRKQGLNWSYLASHFRLYNYFIKSEAADDKIESFIANVSTSDVSPEKVIALVNQLYDVSHEQSIPVHEVPKYIERKIEEKNKIDQEIQQANDVLQSKNIDIESINEHRELNQKLKEHNLSFQDIDKLLKILVNAWRYGFDDKRIASKLYDMQDLERKERGLKNKCKELSKQAAKYKDILQLTEEIAALQIGTDELIALKVGIIQAAKHYNLPPLAATLQLIDDIKKYNKINGLKKELSTLYLQKYALDQACSNQSKSLITLANLKSHGLSEDRLLQLNNFLQYNAYKASSYTSTK